MDAIDKFDIVLDVSDRDRLYDYVERREYVRPEKGGWDFSTFQGKGLESCMKADDENGQMRVRLMDRAIADKRCFEKKSEKETVVNNEEEKGFSYFTFDNDIQCGTALPARIIPIYKAGEIVKGSIELQLNQAIAAERLVVGILGRALVSVRIYHQRGYYDKVQTEQFIREKVPLWENVNSSKSEDLADTFSLLKSSETVMKGTEIPVGKHSFRFEFAIPMDAPQSAPPMVISSHNKGYLMYRIKAAIDKGKTWARGNIVTHKGLWVQKTVDIAENPSNHEPSIAEEIHETFLKKGKITVNAKIPKAGILIGETIPLTLEIYNQASSDIAEVTACIRLHGKARTGTKKISASNKINVKSKKSSDGPVASGSSKVYKFQLPWDFSESSADGNLLPVGDLDDVLLLDVNYDVCVKLTRKGLHRNMELSVPIEVGNKNSRAEKN